MFKQYHIMKHHHKVSNTIGYASSYTNVYQASSLSVHHGMQGCMHHHEVSIKYKVHIHHSVTLAHIHKHFLHTTGHITSRTVHHCNTHLYILVYQNFTMYNIVLLILPLLSNLPQMYCNQYFTLSSLLNVLFIPCHSS